MFGTRLAAVVLVLALAITVVIGATFRALNEEHFGIVNPLNTTFYTAGGGQTGATLQSAITAQGSTQKTLLVPPGTWSLGSSLTVPANISLMVTSGAVLTVGSGATLTINGGFDAPDTTVFAGAGRVRFGKLTRVKAAWWGVNCDGTTNVLTAMNTVEASVSDGTTIMLPYGDCRIGAWDVAGVRGLVFEGAGASPIGATAADGVGTTLRAAGSQTHVMRVMDAQYLLFRNITFDGNGQTTESVVIGEYEGGPSSHITFERSIITRTLPDTGNLLQLGREAEPAGQQQADFWVFREGIIDQDLNGNGTLADRCVQVIGSNVFQNWIQNSRISNCIHSVEMVAGSINLESVDFGIATVAHVQINQSAQSFTVSDSYSEAPTPRFLRVIEGAAALETGPVVYFERNTINAAQAALEWKLTQPLVMNANTFSQTAVTVTNLGDARSKYHVLAYGNRFSGDGIGFGGNGITSVNEWLTEHISTAGVVTVQNNLRADVSIQAKASMNAAAIGSTGAIADIGAIRQSNPLMAFPSVLPAAQQDLTTPITGMVIGDECHASPNTALETGLAYGGCWVSATGVVTIRLINYTAAAIAPAARNWRITGMSY